MLETLRLDGFRSFDSYELSALARVNLLVGRNNCGKTSLLEAIELLAAKGDPFVLLRSLDRRGEANRAPDSEGRMPLWRANSAHLFYGHDFSSPARVRLEGHPGYGSISLRIRPLTPGETNGKADPAHIEETEVMASSLGLEIAGDATEEISVLRVGVDGSLLFPRFRTRSRRYSETSAKTQPTQFLTACSLNPQAMRTMWDMVQIEGRESEVVSAVRLLVSDLESIHFLASDPSHSRVRGAGVLVGLRGARRAPLGSQGDGMRRLLALSLALVNSAGGFLLIDGIDTGLHWTVMRNMWRFVIEAAQQSSVQVFATTHSLDCVRGLASLLADRPDLAPEVCAHKLDRRLDHAVALGAEAIRTAVEQDIELR